MTFKTSAAAKFAIIAALSAGFAGVAHADDKSDAVEFVNKVATANQFEIVTSQLALQKSQNDKVKAFAQEMIADHTKAGADFKTAVAGSTVAGTPVSDKLSAEHQKIYDELKDKAGKDFDKEYVSEQKDAHEDTVKVVRDYAQDGKDASLKAFATRTLPTLKNHEQHIKDVDSAM